MSTYALAQKTRQTFFLIIGIGAASLAGLFFLGVGVYSRLFLLGRSFLGKALTVCDCASVAGLMRDPVYFGVIIAAAVLVCAALVWMIAIVFNIFVTTQRFVRLHTGMQSAAHPQHLSDVLPVLSVPLCAVRVYNTQSRFAFCAGFMRPIIHISQKTLDTLTHDELMAVVAHENGHRAVHEPLRLFVVKILRRILFFVPGFSRLVETFITLSELSADSAATEHFTNRKPLASALYKMVSEPSFHQIQKDISLSFLSAVTNERVEVLLKPAKLQGLRVMNARLLTGICIMVIFLGSIYIFFFSPKAMFAGEDALVSCTTRTEQTVGKCVVQEAAICVHVPQASFCER